MNTYTSFKIKTSTNSKILEKWERLISKWSIEEEKNKEILANWINEAQFTKREFSYNILEDKESFSTLFIELKFKDFHILVDKHWQKGFVTKLTHKIKEKLGEGEVNFKFYSDTYPSPTEIYYLSSLISSNDYILNFDKNDMRRAFGEEIFNFIKTKGEF